MGTLQGFRVPLVRSALRKSSTEERGDRRADEEP
jgi:hypothetical protein